METDILGHLIDIEHNAASILLDAQIEADKRTAEARAKTDVEYKAQYEKLVLELENDCESQIKVDVKEHEMALDAFKKESGNSKQDFGAFNTLVDTLLFGE